MSRIRRARIETIAPTPERIAKGDLEVTPIRYGDQRDADPHRPTVARSRRSSENPLGEFLARNLISEEAYAEGRRFGSLWERTTREVGAVNLDGLGGGSCDGLPFAKVEAMSELHALCRMLGDTDYDRKARETVLIAVCGERRSVREIAGGGRNNQRVCNMLISGLERLARAREMVA